MPLSLKLASIGFIAAGALSAVLGLVLVAIGRLWLSLFLVGLAFAALDVVVGVLLWRRRKGILPAARLLGVLAILGTVSQLFSTYRPFGQPLSLAVKVIEVLIAATIAVSVFQRSTAEALGESPARSQAQAPSSNPPPSV